MYVDGFVRLPRRNQPLSRSHRDRASDQGSWPHLETVRQLRSVLRARKAVGTEIDVSAGVTVPIVKRVAVQPSYIWDNNQFEDNRDMRYVQFGLIVSTR